VHNAASVYHKMESFTSFSYSQNSFQCAYPSHAVSALSLNPAWPPFKARSIFCFHPLVTFSRSRSSPSYTTPCRVRFRCSFSRSNCRNLESHLSEIPDFFFSKWIAYRQTHSSPLSRPARK